MGQAWSTGLAGRYSFRWVTDRNPVVLMQVFEADSGWSFLLSTAEQPAFSNGDIVSTEEEAKNNAELMLDALFRRNLEVA